jgi:hypothetical protein
MTGRAGKAEAAPRPVRSRQPENPDDFVQTENTPLAVPSLQEIPDAHANYGVITLWDQALSVGNAHIRRDLLPTDKTRCIRHRLKPDFRAGCARLAYRRAGLA